MEENIKDYTSRIPSEAWTEAEEIHWTCFMGDNLKIVMLTQVAPTTTKNQKYRDGQGSGSWFLYMKIT